MNVRELKIKDKLESEGWRVLRGGAPDFIALKVNDKGEILSWKGVEVKHEKRGRLTYEQKVYQKVFQLAGIPFEVMIFTKPNHTKSPQFYPLLTKPNLSTPNLPIPAQTIPNLVSTVQSIPPYPTPRLSAPSLIKSHQSIPDQSKPNFYLRS